jgi:pimeloyl-ACP methyl ester carboxylesterase
VVVWLAALGPAVADAKSRLSWTPCFTDAGPFECARVPVPLDYDRPGAAKISIALTRLPATNPRHRIGSLFLNPGGPGGSGVEFVVGVGPFLYTDEVRARFDLVGFDPRGIMRSNALQCFDSPDDWPPPLPIAFPITRDDERSWIASERLLTSACELRAGPIMNHMSTANVARDLDVLRAAVGDRKLSYAGFSYGSYLGNTYANLFPGRVRAVVVDGVLDPIAWSTGRSRLEGRTVPFSTRLHSDEGAQATLNEFFRLCDAAGAACAFSGHAARRFAALAQRLLREPVEITLPDGSTLLLNYSILISATLGALYDSLVWPEFADVLADVEAQVTAPSAALVRRLERFARRPTFQDDEFYPNFLEGFPGVACSDSDNPHRYAAWSINGALADARSGYFGRAWTWASSICAEWPGADRDRYTGPFTRRTANPVLVVGNRFDPATRYEGAVIVHRLLPRSALLSVHGWGHTSLFLSQCADAAVSRYLLTLATPPRGATCEQDVVPFTATAGATEARQQQLRRPSTASRIGDDLQ